MASPEVIALLCAGSQFSKSGDRRSTGTVLSRAELAGLLFGASEAATMFAYACYALDADAERLLIAQVRVHAAHLANRDGWQIVRGRPTVANLSAIAVFEVIRPLVHRSCSGNGCESCGKTGIKPLSGRTIAEAAGLEKMDYFRHWAKRYQQILNYVTGLDGEVQTVLAGGYKAVDVETKKAYK